jgi:hypothetical protein
MPTLGSGASATSPSSGAYLADHGPARPSSRSRVTAASRDLAAATRATHARAQPKPTEISIVALPTNGVSPA